jgi:hypothetical protein
LGKIVREAKEVFKEMEQDGYKPDVYTYNALIDAYK